MSKYYHKNCSQTSQKEEAREETHMEKVWSYHSVHVTAGYRPRRLPQVTTGYHRLPQVTTGYLF